MPTSLSTSEQQGGECPLCGGLGYVARDLPTTHPDFGRLFPCSCKLAEIERRLPAFAHGAIDELAPHLWLISLYHPSRQNTNTRRLTPQMRDQVIQQVAALLDS